MNFYKRYVGDYVRDTGHLSLTEHGAYTVLLDTIYSTGKPLPADLVALCRICRASNAAERRAVASVVDQFFPVNGDGLRHNKRAHAELDAYAEQAATNRRIAVEREEKRKRDESSTNRVTKHEPKPEARSQKELLPLSTPPSPDCPHERIVELYAKHLPTLRQPRAWTSARAKTMRARWVQCSKPTAEWPGYRTQEEGLEFWEQFFAGVAQTSLVQGFARKEGGVWKPDLPWLMNEENFAKVIEGKYR